MPFTWVAAATAVSGVAQAMAAGDAADAAAGASRDQAAASERIAQNQLDFSKQQYADQQARLEKYQPYIDHMLQVNQENLDRTNNLNQQSYQDYQEMYRPNEQRYMQDVAEAGSEDKQAAAAQEAGAGVQSQIDVQRGISAREMASMGVSPDAGRSESTSRVNEVLGAAARAGAEQSARVAERNRGVAARAGAVGVGRGQASLALQGVQVGNQTASTGASVGATPISLDNQAGITAQNGIAGAGSTMLGAGQLNLGVSKLYQNQANDLWKGVGGLVGLFGG